MSDGANFLVAEPQLGWIYHWLSLGAKTLFAPQTHILASAHFRFMELLVYVKYRLAFFKALFGCCFVVKVCQLGFGDARKSAVSALVDGKLEVTIELVFQPDFDVLDFVQLILLVRNNVV